MTAYGAVRDLLGRWAMAPQVAMGTVMLLIVLCLVYPVLSGLLRLWVMTPEITALRVAEAKAFEISNNAAYGHGSFFQAAAEHAREFAFFYDNRWSLWGSFGWYVQMSLTMLLGASAGCNALPT